MGLSVSVIIVNYNTAELLDNCIASVISNTSDVSYEIIVVDNNSEAGSIAYITEKYPAVNFILSDENLGFGRANNLGVTQAKGKYILFLNPDTLLINNAISILCQFMEVNPQAGACGGSLYEEDMSPTLSYLSNSPSRYIREWLIVVNRSRPDVYYQDNNIMDVSAIIGADLFMRKDLFNELGGFDPDFFMYFEEMHLCHRIIQSGYRVVFVPEAKIIHIGGAAAENKNEELNKWSYQEHWYSKFIYFHKIEGKFKTALIYRAHMLRLKTATMFYKLKSNSAKLDYWKKKSEVLEKTYSRYRQYLKG